MAFGSFAYPVIPLLIVMLTAQQTPPTPAPTPEPVAAQQAPAPQTPAPQTPAPQAPTPQAQSPQAESPAPQTTVPGTQGADAAPQIPVPAATAPAEPAPGNVLQDGTPIKLRLLEKLDSHTAKDGDDIPFDVVNDVVVGGVIVLRRGALADGVVTQARSSKTMGRAGRLSFTIKAIELRNGNKAPVRAFSRTSGENRTGEMVQLMVESPIVAAPFFLLIHGTNTTFPRGTEINAFVNGDLKLDMDSFNGALPADHDK